MQEEVTCLSERHKARCPTAIMCAVNSFRIRGSSVVTVTGLRAGSVLGNVHTDCGTQPASCSMRTCFPPWINLSWHEAERLISVWFGAYEWVEIYLYFSTGPNFTFTCFCACAPCVLHMLPSLSILFSSPGCCLLFLLLRRWGASRGGTMWSSHRASKLESVGERRSCRSLRLFEYPRCENTQVE